MPPKKDLKLSAVRLRRISDFSRGVLAACGGEMGSAKQSNTAPFRKLQARGARLALLGGSRGLYFAI